MKQLITCTIVAGAATMKKSTFRHIEVSVQKINGTEYEIGLADQRVQKVSADDIFHPVSSGGAIAFPVMWLRGPQQGCEMLWLKGLQYQLFLNKVTEAFGFPMAETETADLKPTRKTA